MTRPEEAAGLTAALARSIDQRANDLYALIQDDAYRAEIASRNLVGEAQTAAAALNRAERILREIANALKEPAAAAPPRIAI